MTNIIVHIVTDHHMICSIFLSHFLSHQSFVAKFMLTFQLVMRNDGAAEKTRTSTGVTPQRPQRCASTNSATAALSLTRQHHTARLWPRKGRTLMHGSFLCINSSIGVIHCFGICLQINNSPQTRVFALDTAQLTHRDNVCSFGYQT